MKRNSSGDPVALVEFMHAEYPEAFPPGQYAYIDHELSYSHRDLLDRVTKIRDDAAQLVIELSGNAESAWNAVARIEHGAGAGGPINTQYQAAVRNASRIMALVSGFRAGLAASRTET